MTKGVFYVELDNWQNVIKCLKSSAAGVAKIADHVHQIDMPKPHATKFGYRVWLEAESEEEAKSEARYHIKK